MWNIAMQRVVEPGAFEIMVGGNSVDLKSTLLHIGS
jgi:beta-glucosidase